MRRLIALFCLLLAGCGYNLGLRPPDLLKEVHIEEVKAEADPKFSSALYRALREEFQSKGIKVVQGAERRLKGEVVELRFEPIAFDRSAYATQYRASVNTTFKLLQGEEVIWSLSDLRKEKVFTAKGAPALDEHLLAKALEEIARDIAHELYLRLLIAGFRCPCAQ